MFRKGLVNLGSCEDAEGEAQFTIAVPRAVTSCTYGSERLRKAEAEFAGHLRWVAMW